MGLQPGGDSGRFVQRYPIRIEELDHASRVTFDGPAPRTLAVGYDIVLVLGSTGDAPLAAPVVLMWGLPTDSARRSATPTSSTLRESTARRLPTP